MGRRSRGPHRDDAGWRGAFHRPGGVPNSGAPPFLHADDEAFAPAGLGPDGIPDRRTRDPERVTVYAAGPVELGPLLARIGPLGTGDVFCAHDPGDEYDEVAGAGLPESVEATISDTVATFVIDVVRPAPSSPSGTFSTAYTISVAHPGPGGRRLRYRLAAAVLDAVGDGELFDAAGGRIDLRGLADSPWGRLWDAN